MPAATPSGSRQLKPGLIVSGQPAAEPSKACPQGDRSPDTPEPRPAGHTAPDPQAAAKFASAASIDELLVKATRRPTILDPFMPYLNQRWNDGITSATALHAEIRARGWNGDIQAVFRYLRQFRTADGRERQARAQPQLTAPDTPAPSKPRRSPAGS